MGRPLTREEAPGGEMELAARHRRAILGPCRHSFGTSFQSSSGGACKCYSRHYRLPNYQQRGTMLTSAIHAGLLRLTMLLWRTPASINLALRPHAD